MLAMGTKKDFGELKLDGGRNAASHPVANSLRAVTAIAKPLCKLGRAAERKD